MFLSEVTIKGWKSFNRNEGFVLEDLKPINILIGPNNIGKSNFMKYLHDLMLRFSVTSENLSSDTYIEWLDNVQTQKISRTNRWGFNGYVYSKLKFRSSVLGDDKEDLLISLVHGYSKNVISLTNTSGKKRANSYSAFKVCNQIFNSFDLVHSIRDADVSRESKKPVGYDGSSFIRQLEELHSNNHLIKLSELLSYILNERIIVEIFNNRVNIKQNRFMDEVDSLELTEHIGTGVSEVLMILTLLEFRRMNNKPLIFLLEEPELHIHPTMLIRLMDLINKRYTKFQFFITTHSNVLIDQLDTNCGLYRLSKNDDGSSKVEKCTNSLMIQRNLLDDLGVTPAQLLLSNLVIWIEGPSDRIYIKKWIEDNIPGGYKIKEGKHYRFQMYGGSNLTHYGIDEEDLVDIFTSSSYSIIVCDKDLPDDKLKKAVNNLKDKIDSDIEIKKRVFLWITEGKEIENYVPHDCFINAMPSLRQRINTASGPIYVQIKNPKSLNFNAKPEYEFDVFFSNLFVRSDGKRMKKEFKNRIKRGLSSNKTDVAIEVLKHWQLSYYDKENFLFDIASCINMIIKTSNLKTSNCDD
ncbi:AAA family ATPase [Paenibacillus sp. BSR1-1]|uniref:ATP-dependent nuclease n=1 Tax=Paenibacillus sp. BSR1-1 TaxID=3020845 RepID=UPI0025B12D5B|nr:AAA family ATPase [Paenibacillus sp. BSR1-1]MDN3017175.1 AAA family ATPase [Paenibacillus sp. BSR1-1]